MSLIPVNNAIIRFDGDYKFLSNFYPSKIVIGNNVYPTAEHAYQACKTLIPEERKLIRNASTPGRAKRLGRSITLRPDWNDIKSDVMYNLLKQKFSNNVLKRKLLETSSKILVEGNWWNDKYWGVDLKTGKGKNILGKLLMQIREEIKLNQDRKGE